MHIGLYADDAIIFSNPVHAKVSSLLQILEQFGNVLGLRINLAKSLVAVIRCQGFDLDEVLHDFAG